MMKELIIEELTLLWNCLDCCVQVRQPLNRLTESGVGCCPDCGVDDLILVGVEQC